MSANGKNVSGALQGLCPVCGGELEYGLGNTGDGDLYVYDVTCNKCGASGKEFYNMKFEYVVMETP